MDFKLNKSNLNFRVYTAATLPSAAQENDICVISDVPMKNWILSPDAPSGTPRTDGDVWIQYSVAGNTFNALKTGAMMVATISAWQYVDGAWMVVTAKSYQYGEWVVWVEFYYKAGNEYEGITGGWIGEADGYDEATSAQKTMPTIKKTAEYMSILTPYKASVRTVGILKTKNKVNLTGCSKIIFEVEGGALYSQFNLLVYEQVASSPAVLLALPNATIARGLYELNVSALSGEYYIGISGSNQASQSPTPMKVYLVEPK